MQINEILNIGFQKMSLSLTKDINRRIDSSHCVRGHAVVRAKVRVGEILNRQPHPQFVEGKLLLFQVVLVPVGVETMASLFASESINYYN